MRTLFLCPELALQIEGFDTHPYHVAERVHVRFRNRLVSLIIESIHQNGALREINMRPLLPDETLRPEPAARIPHPPEPISPAWVDDFCRAIEGNEGPVHWGTLPQSR